MNRKISLLILSILICPLSTVFSADTDVYVLDQTIQQVPPDILLVLDLSGSMRWTPAGQTMYIDRGNATKSGYQYSCGDDVPYHATSAFPYTNLGTCTIDAYGTVPKWSDATCSGPFYRSARTLSGVAYTTDCSRIEIAKRAIKTVLDADGNGTVENIDFNTLNMRMGYMRFYDCGSDTGTDYNAGCNRLTNPINTPYPTIWSSISSAGATGGTHLANSLREAKLYLDYHKSGDEAKACRKKFVILLSDGADTLSCSGNGSEAQSDQYKRRRETVARAKALSDAGYKVFIVGFGATFPQRDRNTLNWAAYYGGTDNQSVSNSLTGTYLIPSGQLFPSGTTSCSNNSTPDPGAQNISGYAYFAENPSQLEETLIDIRNYILNLLSESTSYVAPVVPISQMESTSSMNRMYLAMFKPTLTSLWLGNIKKFGIADSPVGNIKVGDIVDVNGNAAITPQNEIDKTARSYWSSAADGGEVVKGGVGEKLAIRDLANDPRKIFTYVGLPDKKLLTAPENAFTVENAHITFSTLGIPDDPVKREQIIKFAHGYDAYDWNHNGNMNEKRKGHFINDSGNEVEVDWILGAFIHSRPLIIHYANKSVVYAGANDGMVHAFDDSDGRELWAFISPSLLPRLKDFETNVTLQIFADGPPRAYIKKTGGAITKAILIFGLRRGGDRYIALDVTDPDAPSLLWEIAPPTSSPLLGHEVTTGFGRLGQSWSAPAIKKVANGGEGSTFVAFFAGGYDECNDPNSSCGASDQKGNALYAIDILTGSKLWEFTKTDDPRMTYAIPSDIASLDLNGDGKMDRLYVGDMGGQLWRFDIGNINNTASWTGKVIFRSNQSSGEKRKFFYPPDVSFESAYEWVYIGSGDREHPKQETGTVGFPTRNRIYAVKDTNPSTPLTESNLVDVTSNILQDPNANENDINATLNQLREKNGWFITLEHTGEKCLASPVLYSGVLYYTTFTPSYPNLGDICFLGEGTGRVYVLQYQNGMAMFNYDQTNDIEGQPPTLSKTDRLMDIGSGIPSQVVIAIVEGKVVGYIGVGGGVFSPEVSFSKNIIPLFWRTVF